MLGGKLLSRFVPEAHQGRKQEEHGDVDDLCSRGRGNPCGEVRLVGSGGGNVHHSIRFEQRARDGAHREARTPHNMRGKDRRKWCEEDVA